MGRLNRKIFKLHAWLGLSSGIFILIFFLTGSVIVFRSELNTWENPHLFTVKPAGRYLPYDQLYRAAQQQCPDVYLYSFRYIPQKPDETIEMRIYDPQTDSYPLLYLNPYTGKVLGIERNSLYDILLTLHYKFYLGRVGELMAGIFALSLLGSVLTGTIVFRRFFFRALIFRIPLSFKNWRFAMSGLHRVIGCWALLFNLVLAFSGFYMMLYAFNFKEHFRKQNTAVAPPPRVTVNLDSLIHVAGTTIPGFEFYYLDFPRQPGDALRVTGKSKAWLFGDYNNAVSFDYQSGAVREIFREEALTPAQKFEYALYTLHYGQYGGTSIKLLYSFFGMASAILTLSGFFLWYRRTRC
jgi:uncharacterized iron-regulated membrane protein